ncbi:MAG: RNA polymerase sigma factor [Planctomycetota bacterium]
MVRKPHPDLEIARRIAEGDEKAAEGLFLSFSGELFGYAQRLLGDSQTTEDVLQETLFGALKAIRTFDGRIGLRAWIFGILRHKIIDALRKKKREVRFTSANPELDLFDQAGKWKKNVTITPFNENAEILDVVRGCMEELPFLQREALTLRALKGLTSQEAADIMKLTNTNVRQILHRARQAVRRCAEAKLGGPV